MFNYLKSTLQSLFNLLGRLPEINTELKQGLVD